MPGTKAGAVKAAKTLEAKLGGAAAVKVWRRHLGTVGGSARVPKGFAMDRERAVVAGQKGGMSATRRQLVLRDCSMCGYSYKNLAIHINRTHTSYPQPV